MNLLFDPGMLPVNRLNKSFEEFSKKNNLFLVTKRIGEECWNEISNSYSVYSYNNISNVESVFLKEKLCEDYCALLKLILNDSRTILLAERAGCLNAWKSAHNTLKEIEVLIFNIVNFLKNKKINCVMFQATPHSLLEWILGKTAEGLGIKVLMLQTSPIPWRYWIVQGIDNQIPISIFDRENLKDEYLDDFIEINLSDYSKAIPDYEKKRIEARKGRFWSWKKELKDIFVKPHRRVLSDLLFKRSLYLKYESLCLQKIDSNKKNIIFLMHYQPERTSLPEGKLYAQQWLLIRQLSMNLPDGWLLYVKEHPSTFTGKFVPKYRDMKFYDDIATLSNVHLISLETDTFSLIDNSNGIATITGTVGVQALVRGKPVLAFGYASYRNAYGVFEINSEIDIREAMSSIGNIDKTILETSTKEYLRDCVNKTVIADDLSHNIPPFNYYHSENRTEGHISLLKLFLKKYSL